MKRKASTSHDAAIVCELRASPEFAAEYLRAALEEGGVMIFRGRLRESAAAAYDKLRHAFGAQSVPLLQQDAEMGAAIFVMPRPVEQAILEKRVRPWLNWLLFAATALLVH